ncbi:hypothetical protein [Micrococcus endophyticus]|uniref:hypothetical protein n=1 Tax=Micrococcus endophyticus TaxID=455343 RepID=UPI0034CEBA6B
MSRPAPRPRPASHGGGAFRPRPTTAPPALPDRPGWVRLVAGGVVPALVAAAAVLAALQVFVLNPLAAGPGDRALGQVYADLGMAGEGALPFLLPALLCAAGLGVAAILWFLVWRREEVDPLAVLALGLASLVAATPAYFFASFGMGMSLADTYGIGGADHSPWARPVYVLSALALAALVAVVVLLLRGPAGGRATPRPTR